MNDNNSMESDNLGICEPRQPGLTLAQCAAKFGKVGYNHGGCYWNRNGFKMEFGEGDTEPF
jgi:hypothetical protein